MEKTLFQQEELAKIRNILTLNKTDKDKLLVFFEKYTMEFEKHHYQIETFKTNIDNKIERLVDNLTANERKLEASILLSEKKIKQQSEMINSKYDNLKFNNYVNALNKKDVSAKNLSIFKSSFGLEKKENEEKFASYVATLKERALESRALYNLQSTTLSQKSTRKIRRLRALHEELSNKEALRFLAIEDSLISKINSIKLNKIEYDIKKQDTDTLIKNHYNNISLTVNKRIKDENIANQINKERLKIDYEGSLLPLNRNKEYIDKNFTQTKNDISFKYSNILDEVNKMYDKKKRILEKKKAQLEKSQLESIINETNEEEINNKKLEYDLKIQGLEKELNQLREQWVLDIDRRNNLRKLEISKHEAIHQTNLKKLNISYQIRERQYQLSLENIDLEKKLLLLPYEINRELSFKQRNIHLQIIENEYESLVLDNEMLCLSTELELALEKNVHQYNLEFYKIKFDYLQTKLRLKKQLQIESFKLRRDHYLTLLSFEENLAKKQFDLETFKKQFPLNQAQIDNIHVNNLIEQEKLLSDFIIEQERNSTLSQNEGKLNNLSLHRLKEIDNSRINHIRSLIRLLSIQKKEYYYALLDYLNTIPSFFNDFYNIFIPLFSYLDHASLIIINNIYVSGVTMLIKNIKADVAKVKSNILGLCKIDILNDSLLKQSYASFANLRSEIIVSFKEILTSTIKNLELQITNLFKDLEKTRVLVSDIILAEKSTSTASRLRETISSINVDLQESSLFSKISTEFGGLTLNYAELKKSDDDSYLNNVVDMHQTVFSSLDKTISKILEFLSHFSMKDPVDSVHSLKSIYNDASIVQKTLDTSIFNFKEALDSIDTVEYNYLNETLKNDQGLLIENYNSAKKEFHLYEQRVQDLDQKIVEYHQIILEYTSEKLTKNNRDNLNYGTYNFNKQIERKVKEIDGLQNIKREQEASLDKILYLNKQNLDDSLIYSKKTRNSAIKRLNSSLRDINEHTKHQGALTIEKNKSLLKMANTRIDHQIDLLKRTRKEYIELLEHRIKDIFSSKNEHERETRDNQLDFKKRLALEDKKYQLLARGIEKVIKKERV